MIRYVSLFILLLIESLSMISRKHFSKYKDRKNPIWWLSENISVHLPAEMKSKLAGYMRRTDTFGGKQLKDLTEEWIVSLIYKILMMVTALSALIFVLSFVPEKKDVSQSVKRPEVGNSSDYAEIELYDSENDEKETYELEVHSREYTEKEFKNKTDACKKYLEKRILGKNGSADEIVYDMDFPSKDETGTLKVTWETSVPTVLSSSGKVDNTDIDDGVEVNIVATIKDDNFQDTYETDVTVVKDENLSSSEKAKLKMLEIEEGSRSDAELVLPEKIGSVEVKKIEKGNEEKFKELFVFGILFIALWAYYGLFKLKDKGIKRTEELDGQYYGFVNRLSIYISAGLTIQNALKAVMKNKSCKSLNDEITFTLNKIASGEPEAKAYMEMGKNLGTQDYAKLMSLISQNLEYGNSNLIKLMDSEVKLSFYLKKETIRKKGEKASEKLLIPTLILMFIVMAIVMYPAFVGMG